MNSFIMDSFHINPYELNDDQWVDSLIGAFYRLELQQKQKQQ